MNWFRTKMMRPAAPLWFVATASFLHLISVESQYGFGPQQEQCIAVDWALDAWLPAEQAGASVEASDSRLKVPSLTQYYYNSVLDVHSTISAKDTELIFSPNGNWQLALYNLLHTSYFPANPSVKDSYLITTSPPISYAQMENGLVKVGNIMYTNAAPHLVAAPPKFLTKLTEAKYLVDDPIPIIQTYGNVILKRKGDSRIQTFWDLDKIQPGRFASSVPLKDSESYNNYRTSVYNIAMSNPRSSDLSQDQIEKDATALVERLFDTDPNSNITTSESGVGVVSIGPPMHRSIPHCIATMQADAGLFFLHLAVYAMINNPGVFEVVYLGNPNSVDSTTTDRGSSTSDANVLALGQTPLEGNRVGHFSVARTITKVNEQQYTARENMVRALQSNDFTTILEDAGMKRPSDFVSDYVPPAQKIDISGVNGATDETRDSSGYAIGTSRMVFALLTVLPLAMF